MSNNQRLLAVVVSAISGVLSFCFLAFSLALSSGNHALTANYIIANICTWSALFHGLISSWLFIPLRVAGHWLAVLTSATGLTGMLIIMANGMSFVWFMLALCFLFTLVMHITGLMKRRLKSEN